MIEGDTIVNNDDDNEGGFAKNDEEDENVIYRACSEIRDTFGPILTLFWVFIIQL